MACSLISYSSSVSTLILVIFMVNVSPLISITPSNMQATLSNDNITDICNDKMPDVQFCLQVFNSIPGTNQAKDLKTLVLTTIDYALKNGTGIHDHVVLLLNQTADSPLKDVYDVCSEEYKSFIGVYQDAEKSFHAGDFKGLDDEAKAGSQHINNCIEAFDDFEVEDPNPLSYYNKTLDVVSQIVSRISERLHGS